MREARENLYRRLYYQAAHRGMKEADLLLGAFARIHLPLFDDNQLAEFDRLLQLQDRDILNWRFGRVPLPPECDSSVMGFLLAFNLMASVGMDSI